MMSQSIKLYLLLEIEKVSHPTTPLEQRKENLLCYIQEMINLLYHTISWHKQIYNFLIEKKIKISEKNSAE